MNVPFCLVAIMLIPLAAAGLALIQQGLGRSRSAAHAMLATLCAMAVSAIVFVTIGFSFAGFSGGLAHIVSVAGLHFDWLGAEPLFAGAVRFDPSADPRPALTLCFQLFAAGLAAIIPISAGSDRWRLGPLCLASALLAAFTYPLFAHWVWGGGWLAQLGPLFGLPAFTDLGGAGVIHAVGGLMALSVVWIIGSRRGKYSDEGIATAIPGHNIVQVLLGCLLALVGWIGLDAAASMLFYAAPPEQVIAVIINAMLSASAGALAVVVTTRFRYRKPDASLSANGWIAGLVAGSASCGLISPSAAIFIGIVAGVLVAFLVELLELRLLIDDPGGAISVHAGAGLWGLLAFGLFAPVGFGSMLDNVLTQCVGIATLLGLMFPLIHAGNLLLNRFFRFRVDTDGDWQGMDIRELGAGAYPEFVIHADEFVPR
jgi:Amt family ammonium transporter